MGQPGFGEQAKRLDYNLHLNLLGTSDANRNMKHLPQSLDA